MQYSENIQLILKEMGKKTEYSRFLSGMGRVVFSKSIGMHFHTYKSFLDQDRMTKLKNIEIIMRYLKDRDLFEDSWNDRLLQAFKAAE